MFDKEIRKSILETFLHHLHMDKANVIKKLKEINEQLEKARHEEDSSLAVEAEGKLLGLIYILEDPDLQ